MVQWKAPRGGRGNFNERGQLSGTSCQKGEEKGKGERRKEKGEGSGKVKVKS